MNYYFISLGLIYFIAVFFWFRYLYNHSLRTAADRVYTVKKIAELSVYLPLGLQAAFLFPYAVIQLFPLGIKTAELFERAVLRNSEIDFPELYPISTIIAGSLIIGISYTLFKTVTLISNRSIQLLARLILFTGTLFMLKAIVQNIFFSLRMGLVQKVNISYDNNYIWIVGLLLAGVLMFTRPKEEDSGSIFFVKYLALTGRILLFYCFLLLLIGTPRIVYLVIEKLF